MTDYKNVHLHRRQSDYTFREVVYGVFVCGVIVVVVLGLPNLRG